VEQSPAVGAMEDPLTAGFASRARIDDDEEADAEETAAETAALPVWVYRTPGAVSRARTLLVGVGPLGCALLHFSASAKAPWGSAVLPEVSMRGNAASPGPLDRSCWLAHAPELDLVACAVGYDAAQERCGALAKALHSAVAFDRCVVLAEMPAGAFRGPHHVTKEDDAVYVLDTDARRARDGAAEKRAVAPPPLPPGNVASGVGAAVAAMCQARGQDARLLLGVRRLPIPDSAAAEAAARWLDREVPGLGAAEGARQAGELLESELGRTSHAALFT